MSGIYRYFVLTPMPCMPAGPVASYFSAFWQQTSWLFAR
jgi:hypothetical protein